ncbi:exo-beta-N-acetylmuramidase NamZ family protein [Chryseobacterium balustinum]|uniref:exo-beta-N-acetylmuramidase NamZ family protein n=1 Tax=Chryseobacterium balustinum TaxID=246 RepID=UPI003CF90E34
MNLNFKIKTLVLICLIFLGVFSQYYSQTSNKEGFKTGADQPEKYLGLLKNKRVAVVTNQTGLVTRVKYYNAAKDPSTGCAKAMKIDTLSIVDFLVENKINIKSIFAPEHGFRGDADAGEKVKNGVDVKTGISIVSLYGNNKKPKPDQLKDIDVVVFDIQDVGVRFYTYISTLTYLMEAAAENNVEIMVLDRPNPHDGYIDGPVLKKKWESFVGMHEVPVVYGLTIGEYGKMVNGEKWLKNGVQAKYTLIEMKNYHKKKRYAILDKPSPNLPNDKSINLYPSLCFFEGTQVSVGRGTNFPFQVYGSPWTKDLPYQFTPKPNFGAKDPFLNGKLCYGENLSDYSKNLREINLEWLIKAYKNYKNPQQDFFLKNLFFDTLAGSDELRKQIVSGKSEKEIKSSWKADLEKFSKIRSKYIVYED